MANLIVESSQADVESKEKRRYRLPKSVLATLTALLDECVKEEGCGWLHAYAIAEKMGMNYRTVRLALLTLHRMRAVTKRERVVNGRVRIEYALTPAGKRLAVEQLRMFFSSSPKVEAKPSKSSG